MAVYEIVAVYRGDVGDDGFVAQVDTLKTLVGSGGDIQKVDQWGKRHLAYPIAKQRDGYYVVVTADLPPSQPFEIERTLRLNESVLRFLVIRQGS